MQISYHCRVNFTTFSVVNFLKLGSKLRAIVDPKFFGSISSDKRINCLQQFLWNRLIPLPSQWNKFRRNIEKFSRLPFLASVSTYAIFIHHVSFLSVASTFIFLKLRVTRKKTWKLEKKGSLYEGDSFLILVDC